MSPHLLRPLHPTRGRSWAPDARNCRPPRLCASPTCAPRSLVSRSWCACSPPRCARTGSRSTVCGFGLPRSSSAMRRGLCWALRGDVRRAGGALRVARARGERGRGLASAQTSKFRPSGQVTRSSSGTLTLDSSGTRYGCSSTLSSRRFTATPMTCRPRRPLPLTCFSNATLAPCDTPLTPPPTAGPSRAHHPPPLPRLPSCNVLHSTTSPPNHHAHPHRWRHSCAVARGR
jgi:hypothetical protein